MARALYIHWPFCLAKCPYCDFNSHVRDSVDHEAWQAALLADMASEARHGSGAPLTSIFFGGGTPSLMLPTLVERLIAQAETLWSFDEGIEITLEANPSSVEAANFASLAAAGVNRVSLGLQSLDDEALVFLGRLHDVSEGLSAVEVAQKHFDRVSVDLIYARPEQSPDQWRDELLGAISLGTTHLSLYQLTIEPGTRFATRVRNNRLHPLEDDSAADLFALTRDLTASLGLPAYEISNHALPGEESRHNLTYWRYEDYHGIGPGAHGRRGGLATNRHRKPENWLEAIAQQGNGICEERALSSHEQAAEALLMGMRLAEGVDIDALADRLALPAESLIDAEKAGFYESKGLLARNDGLIRVTDEGMPLLDALLGELVPAELAMA